jgi:hypothetical protein
MQPAALHRGRRESDSESLSDGLDTSRAPGAGGSNTNRIHSGFDGKIEYKTLANEVGLYKSKSNKPRA